MSIKLTVKDGQRTVWKGRVANRLEAVEIGMEKLGASWEKPRPKQCRIGGTRTNPISESIEMGGYYLPVGTLRVRQYRDGNILVMNDHNVTLD